MKITLDASCYKQKEKENTVKEVDFLIDKDMENELVNLYPEITYQVFEGFGGALTDAAGYVYAQMSEEQKKEILETYFGEGGMEYHAVRVPIDSCDFSVEQFQALSDCDDREFKTFDMKRELKYIFPLIEDVQKILGKPVEIMVTPWSPPDFMKTNKMRIQGGSLLPEYKEMYADYLSHYIKELKKLGCDIKRLSIQNEPKAVQTWDSCVMTAEEEKEFLRDYLYPSMVKNGLDGLEIFIWDHNKERVYERACTIIDETTDHMIAGIAFHWYSGDHFEALDLVREKFPDKKLILSEACIEYSKFSTDGETENVKKYVHDIIGNLNAGMNAFYDWNILLDDKGGPNHVSNLCDAPYMYNVEQGKLEERMTLSAIGHFSRYIVPGSVRVAFSRYTDKLEFTSFKRPDGRLAVVIFNRTEDKIPVTLRIGEECASFEIDGCTLVSGMIE